MNPNKQWQGRKSKAMGEIFEKRIEHALNLYDSLNVAYIQKTPEPFRVIRRIGDGRFEGYFEKKGQPDFKGVLKDGSTIIFEAKHTDSDRILQSVVTETQADFFDKYQNMGARCYVMVSLGLSSFYRIPWHIWKDMKSYAGHKYLNAEDMAEFKLAESSGIIQILEGIKLKECENNDFSEK